MFLFLQPKAHFHLHPFFFKWPSTFVCLTICSDVIVEIIQNILRKCKNLWCDKTNSDEISVFDIFNFDFSETFIQMETLIQLFRFEVRGKSSESSSSNPSSYTLITHLKLRPHVLSLWSSQAADCWCASIKVLSLAKRSGEQLHSDHWQCFITSKIVHSEVWSVPSNPKHALQVLIRLN